MKRSLFKKKQKIVIVIIVFLLSVCLFCDKNEVCKAEQMIQNNYINSQNINNDNLEIEFKYKEKLYKFSDFSFNIVKTEIQQNLLKTISDKINTMNFAVKNGFTIEESVIYSFPEIEKIYNELKKNIYKQPIESYVESILNTGNIFCNKSKNGVCLDKKCFYNDVFYVLSNYFDNAKKTIYIKDREILPTRDDNYIADFILKSSYKTTFINSVESRKNNIKVALSKFDGVVLKPNDVLSFNKTTGVRNEENGYKKAKIIKNGTYYNEYGGGVCQVSTTIYNAALLAGLEILEVHPHSLPISYEKPCFDAMVNTGSSDLIIKNNTDGDIIFATSNKNDICLVNIYGKKNEYDIVRKSEKIMEFENYVKETSSDYKKYGFEKPLNKGEEVVVSYGKPGYKAVGILEYYKNGVLIKTKKIRENIYNPTKQVVLVSD